jgi:hypothetical protein
MMMSIDAIVGNWKVEGLTLVVMVRRVLLSVVLVTEKIIDVIG